MTREPSHRLFLGLFAVAFGTNVPTPLLLAYREYLGLSPTVLTTIFGVYALGLVPTLFVAGPASDRFGRKAVVFPFAVISLLASATFLGARDSLTLLLLGRLAQGAVSGAVFSVGSAWMNEITSDPGVAARRAATALSLGFGIGPLSAGLLAQWAPAPLLTPYLLHIALVGVGLAALHGVPETISEYHPERPWLNIGIPSTATSAFWSFVVPVGLCVFTFPSVSLTVLPIRLQSAMPGYDLALTGAVGGATMTAGVLAQGIEKRVGPFLAAPLGGASGVGGLIVGGIAAITETPWLLLGSAVLLGAAYGLSLAAGLTAVGYLAAPEAKGAFTATFYAVTYLGFAVPLILSSLSDGSDYDQALLGLAALMSCFSAFLLFGPGRATLAQARQPAVPSPQAAGSG